MLYPRIIPCLLVHNKGLVKSVKFSNHKYVGDPINAVKIFNEKEVELNERIKEDKAAHDAAIAAATRTFTERLRKSEGRAKTYAGMSQASADERTALADHAAKLDQSLEEGRHLVRELRETLGQRDREIMLLGEHIQNVYQLINNTGNSNGTTDSGNS